MIEELEAIGAVFCYSSHNEIKNNHFYNAISQLQDEELFPNKRYQFHKIGPRFHSVDLEDDLFRAGTWGIIWSEGPRKDVLCMPPEIKEIFRKKIDREKLDEIVNSYLVECYV